MDVLAIIGIPISKQIARDLCEGKNIYQSNVLGDLKKIGAIFEDRKTNKLRLQSLLFRSAILSHIMFTNKENKPHIISAKTFLQKNNSQKQE